MIFRHFGRLVYLSNHNSDQVQKYVWIICHGYGYRAFAGRCGCMVGVVRQAHQPVEPSRQTMEKIRKKDINADRLEVVEKITDK